ncbi:MAG: hypothetical protein ACREPM_08215, partial [Gemmatimonadaceae bacterium]
VLLGSGDLAHLLIDVGHDVRASRILVARLAQAAKVAPASLIPGHSRGESRISDRQVPRADLGLGASGDGGDPPIP